MTSSTLPHSAPAPLPLARRRTARQLALHYVEMLAAMLVGMAVLGPVRELLVPGLSARDDVMALLMATDMAVGMAVWMRVRRSSWSAIGEMSAAMYVPFLVLLVPYWAGSLPGDALLTWGHVLMLPAMAVPLVRGRHEHAC